MAHVLLLTDTQLERICERSEGLCGNDCMHVRNNRGKIIWFSFVIPNFLCIFATLNKDVCETSNV